NCIAPLIRSQPPSTLQWRTPPRSFPASGALLSVGCWREDRHYYDPVPGPAVASSGRRFLLPACPEPPKVHDRDNEQEEFFAKVVAIFERWDRHGQPKVYRSAQVQLLEAIHSTGSTSAAGL